MHTASLRTELFRVQIDGRAATVDDVFPSWQEHDRIGVVMFSPLGAVGASMLLQLAIAKFYDDRRTAGMLDQQASIPGFLTYPDFYVFHVNGKHGNFSMMDFYPPNKEVFVADSGDELLAAINDRAITRLLIEDRLPGDANLELSAVDSATRRISSALAYARTGRVSGDDVRVTATDPVAEGNVRGTLDPDVSLAAYNEDPDPRVTEAMRLIRARRGEVTPHTRMTVAMERSRISQDGLAVEAYRRIPMEEAFRIIAHRN